MALSLNSIDDTVSHGNTVISTDTKALIAVVENAIDGGTSATFYLPQEQYDAIIEWYWTPERRDRYGLEEVSDQEKRQIKSELGVADTRILYSNRIPCPKCHHVYGAFEFIQQGIQQHGRETVEVALNMANACVLRVNPSTVPVCPNCSYLMQGEIHYYICRGYGCCMNWDVVIA